MNYFDTLIEVANDCPTKKAQVPLARGGKDIWPKERKKFLSKGHQHLRVSPLAKRYGWGIHNNVAGKIALIAIESSRYKQLLDDPHTTKVKAFRSTRG